MAIHIRHTYFSVGTLVDLFMNNQLIMNNQLQAYPENFKTHALDAKPFPTVTVVALPVDSGRVYHVISDDWFLGALIQLHAELSYRHDKDVLVVSKTNIDFKIMLASTTEEFNKILNLFKKQ